MTKPTSIAGAASPRTKAGRDLADFLNTETGGGDYSQSILAIEAEASQRQEAACWDDPTFDGTEGAHPAWWRGSDHTAAVMMVRLQEASQRQAALEKALREAADLDQALAEDFHEAYVAWVERYEALLDPPAGGAMSDLTRWCRSANTPTWHIQSSEATRTLCGRGALVESARVGHPEGEPTCQNCVRVLRTTGIG